VREKLAYAVSFIFNPALTIPLVFLLMVFKSELTFNQLRIVLPLLFLVDVVLPATTFFLSLKKGWLSDWEITRRSQRVNFFLVLSFFLLLGTVICLVFGNKLLGSLHLIFNLAFFLATLVTIFWKISIHMLVDTVVIGLINFLFAGHFYLYLLLPVIAWSRYVRHQHTPGQLLAGFLLALIVTSLLFF
jgi:hypothetical protein